MRSLKSQDLLTNWKFLLTYHQKYEVLPGSGSAGGNLYLDNGVTVLLPEKQVEAALARVAALDASQHLLSKGVKSVDLRFPGRVIVAIARIEETAAEKAKVKLSQSE